MDSGFGEELINWGFKIVGDNGLFVMFFYFFDDLFGLFYY